MVIKFDIFGDAKTPKMTLHNPNGQQVGIISEFKDMTMNINLMELSTLSFSVPHNNLFYDEIFDKLKRPRIIKVEGIGQFIIDEPIEISDGVARWKHVECKSLEYELNRVTVRILEGIYKFYDVVNPSETILGKVMSYLPNWKLGSVDSDLWNTKRMFDDTTETAYSILVGSISETFKCVFRFNTITRTIDVKKYENITRNTDIVVGYSNLVKSLEIGESPDGMFTCLNVIGAGDISINEVNPLGTSKIYNYDYYLNHTDKDGQYLMSSGLRNAITSWKAKIVNNTQSYKDLIASIKVANGELITLNQQLTDLKSEYTTLETLYTVKIEQGLPVSEVRQQMYDKENQIAAKEIEVANKKTQLENLMKQKSDINKSLSPTNTSNFTQVQQEELALFTNEDGYSDEHLCVTDTMTENEKMEVYQELYDKAMGILSEVSQPVYSFNTSLVNYLMLGEYETFTKQTDLGCVIRLEIEKGRFVYPILLGYTLNFNKDKRSDVEMNWGSTLRLTNDANSVKKLLDKAVSGGNKVGLDSHKWNLYEKDQSAISDYMKGSLDASLQNIKNADNQEIVFGANGIIGRRSNGDGTYSPEAFWMMNNTWVMTDDDFQTAKLAIGKILLPDGVTKAYGINSELVCGKLLIGNQLHIENESLTFRVDAEGVTIKNGNILMTNDSGKDETIEQVIKNTQDKASIDLGNAIEQVNKDMGDMAKTIEDGMIEIFYQDTAPITGQYKVGDMWYDTSVVNGVKKNESWLAVVVNGTLKWEKIKDAEITKALSDASNAQTTADGKITSYYSTSMPTNGKNGDLWFDTDDGNKMHRHNGVTFVVVDDGRIQESLNKINNVINATTGEIRTDKLIGSIEAGKNNIDIINNATTKAMKMNEAGILIANSKTGSAWDWKTAISADGIMADAIKANGTLSGCHILGGDLNIGNGRFNVDSLGNATASSITITGGNISGTGININNKFIVDTIGGVTASNLSLTGGRINLADKFVVDSNGNVTMTGNISWGASNSPVKTQYSANNSSWHDSFQNGDLYIRYSYDGGKTWTTGMKFMGTDGINGSDGKDAVLPGYIKQTYISQTEIQSPTITGNVTTSAVFNGGIYKTWGSGVNGGQLDNNGLRLYNSTTQIANVGYTNTNTDGNANALLIQSLSNYALKISSSGDMSLSSGGSIWMGSNVRLKSGVKIYDASGQEISGSGVAVFG